jgi:hypothetical protein
MFIQLINEAMKYPIVLGKHICILPKYARSVEWFASQPVAVKMQFWIILEKFDRKVAAEYLRDNHSAPSVESIVSRGRRTELTTAKKNEPLKFSGTVIGELWPHGVSFLLGDGQTRYTQYGRSVAGWKYLAVVTVGGRKVLRTSDCSGTIRPAARRVVSRAISRGASLDDIKVEFFHLKLEQVEMIGNRRKVS